MSFAVESEGTNKIQGMAALDASATGNPLRMGVKAETGNPTAVADGDAIDVYGDEYGNLGIFLMSRHTTNTADVDQASADAETGVSGFLQTKGNIYGLGPDGSWDRLRAAQDIAPGLGALNVAPIGGDITLRASATAAANGTSTAVDELGWIRNFHAVLDVTVAAAGVTTLDVYIQTQMAEGTWQDVAHFPQVTTSAVKHLMAWGGIEGGAAGTQAEGAAVTVDNYWTNEDAGLAASTVRRIPLGNSMRVKFVYAGDGAAYTFAVTISAHS